jgi:zinc protease
MRRSLASIGLAFALLLAIALPASAQRFGAQTFTLSNGMQVVVIPNHRVPAVTHMVWYRCGAADEKRGKSGIAHFLEHLMFKGTKEVPDGMISRLIAQNGGRDNAFTTQDYTAYYETVAVDRLELVMKLEADRMQNLQLTDAVVLPERDVIIEERHMRIDNEPAAQLDEQVRATLFQNHPYRIPTIGWEQEMRQLTTQDAIDWYRTWYTPSNAILVVSGDIEAEQLRPLAEKYYGSIPARPVPPRDRVSEPQKVAAMRVELKSPRVAQPSWSRQWIAPSYHAGETRHAYALQVLADALGGGVTSRLYRSLVLDQQIALSAGAFYNPGALDLGTFGVYASPKPGVEVKRLEAAMEAELKKLLQEGISDEETKRSVTRMQVEAVYARDSLAGPANIFGAALATGRSVEDVETWPAKIGEVTTDEVNEAARYVVQPVGSVTGVLLPEPTS